MNYLELIIEWDENEPEAAEVYVDGKMGKYEYRFLMDTGAAKTSVVFDDYTATLTIREKSASSGVLAAASDDLVTVPKIEVGPISKDDFLVARGPANTPNTKSLLGMDIFKDFCCRFMFSEGRVYLDRENDIETEHTYHELFLDKTFHPYVNMDFGTLTTKAVWDTGASLTVVNMGFIEENPSFFASAGESEGTDSTGAKMRTPMFIMKKTEIGGSVFPACRVAGVDLSRVNSTLDVPMNVILGFNMLNEADWLFDFPKRKWAILSKAITL